MSRIKSGILRRIEPLRLGFLAVSDCAPVVYAYEAGLFTNYGLDVELSRESGWAALRDKVISGELDAAHAPATLPFLANLGVESDPCACVSAMVLNLHGNAITISRQLWDEGARDAGSLRELIFRHWKRRTYTFGVLFPYSCQHVLLRQWLQSGGINPEAHVRVVPIPPTQMFPTLKLGYLDGFCAGEPWTSVAVQAEVGVCVATSSELAPLHPEKVLMVRQSFALGRADEHERMIAALLEACAFCDKPQNRPLLSELLAHPHYVNAPAECLHAGLVGPFHFDGHRSEPYHDLNIFHQHGANEPTEAKAAWVMDRLYELLELESGKIAHYQRTPVLKNVFRPDIFERAKVLTIKRGQALSAKVFKPVLIAGAGL
jgi:ABC-type nitrate/sulfonate/bicarbonate transport system substrate-binding protein